MYFFFQVGRALQPSVFYVGDCEKMFKKKIPKTDPVSFYTIAKLFLVVILESGCLSVHQCVSVPICVQNTGNFVP